MALGEPVIGAGFLTASSAGLMATAAVSPLNFDMGQLAIVSGFAALGAIGRVFMDGQAARQQAQKDGVDPSKRPEVDYVALGYALLGAPFVGDVAWTLIQYVHFIPDSAAVAVIMGLGYLGRDGINPIISGFQRLIGSKLGGDK